MTDDAYMPEARAPSIPPGAAARIALKRAGLSLGAGLVGAYGLGAVATYSPEDPSFNVAADGPTHNLFGGPGAAFADIAIQSLGAAAPLAMGALFAAGALRVWRRRLAAPIERGRLLAGAAGVALLGAAAATIPSPDGWPLATGLGGVLGQGASDLIQGLLSMPGLPFPQVLTGVLCAGAGLIATGWAFQVRGRDVLAAGRAAAHAGGAAQRALTYVADKVRPEEPLDPWNAYNPPLEDRSRQRPAPRRAQPAPDMPAEPPARPIPQHFQAEPAEPPPRRPAASRQQAQPKPAPQQQQHAQQAFGRFELPSGALLAPPKPRVAHADQQSLHAMSRQLETVLADFGVQGEIVSARPGPVVTLFELEPAAGVKSSRVIGLADDIARSM
ncbi:MAG: DNA translocase FtsK 4TM domain-containing protein, partial [Hyphomonadaceae bacterium]